MTHEEYAYVKDLLLKAQPATLDPSVKPLIEKWSTPPTPIQVLEVLDLCVNGGLTNRLGTVTLQAIYFDACLDHKTTHEEVVTQAHWRK